MGRKIKVSHVCDKFGVKGSSIHGVSRLFSWWLPLFDKEQLDIQLIGLRKDDEAGEFLKQEGIDVISLNKGKFDFTTIKEIVKIVRRKKIDILHLHGYGASNFGRMAARFIKVKCIVHEHFVDPAMPKYQVPFDYIFAQYTDLGIANCEAVKDFMVENRFLDRKKVKVVYNGVPCREFKPVERRLVEVERKKWNIPGDYWIIASIGRVDEQKGNRYLIDAAKNILKVRHKVKFMIIGDGPLLDELKEQCKRYGISKDVIFTGYQSNIRLILSMIDMQVIPSLWEGTTLTVFEAMSMKKPIVSTNVDGLSEVLCHEKNALLVPPKNTEKLSTAIDELLANPNKAQRLAVQAEKDSYAFDIQNTVNQLQQIYNELMN